MLASASQQLRRIFADTPSTQLIANTARREWKLIGIGVLTTLVAALTEGLTLGIIYLVVQLMSDGDTASSLPWLLNLPLAYSVVILMAGAVLAQALQSLMSYCNKLSIGYFAARSRATITALIHHQVLSFTFPCASQYKVGELTNFNLAGTVSVRTQIECFADIAVNLSMGFIYLVVLLTISPWLLLAAVFFALVITVLLKNIEPRIRKVSQHQADIDKSISSRVVEDYQALRLLHSSGLLELADQRLQDLMHEMEINLRSQAKSLAVLQPVSSLMPILGVAIIVSLSFLFIGDQAGIILPGLVTFVLALQRLNVRIGTIGNAFNILAENSGRLAFVDSLLDSNDKQFRRLGGACSVGLRDQIRFDGVFLRYNSELPYAIKGLDFSIFKGQTLALVGPSGSGKSSIADLLVGIYSPTKGEIWIDDQPLSRMDISSWQKHLGVVSQDTFLFNMSIFDNLAFGLASVTRQDVEHAAAQAQASGFIESLPNGYNTLVGERGYRLSGGQRQRLSLARALLRRPDLLILDEATSALDTQSERLVQQAIQSVQFECTTLIIAHRLSTIVNANHILVLDDGQVAQAGTHDQLIAQTGIYKNLWVQQSQSLKF